VTAILILCSVIAFQQENVDWGRPYFGISFQPVNEESRRELKALLEEKFKAPSSRISINIGSEGMVVSSVATEIKGLDNNLQPGDVIKSLAGVEAVDVDSFIELLAKQTPGEPVELSILRPTLSKNRVSFSKQIVTCTPISEFISTTSKYTVTEDEFKNRTFYVPTRQAENSMMIYIAKKEGEDFYQVVRFRCNDIIGLRMAEVLIDGEVFRFENTLSEKLDNTVIGRNSHQWFDRLPDQIGDLIPKIEAAKEVKLRLRGRAENFDIDIQDAIVSNIKVNRDMIAALKWKEAQKK